MSMISILIADNPAATVFDFNPPPNTKFQTRNPVLPLWEESGLPRSLSQYDVACGCHDGECRCGIELENWRNEQSLLMIRRNLAQL